MVAGLPKLRSSAGVNDRTHSDSSASGPLTGLTKRAQKRTKIIATIGPSSREEGVLRSMFHAGMNVARLNMSHGTLDDHLGSLQLIRRLGAEMERPVAVLADLQGPKIRTGKLRDDQPVQWVAGAATVITVGPCPAGDATRVGCTYVGLAADVQPGDRLLVDDGRMRLRVERVEGDDIHCTVQVGGTLKNNKGINLPGVKVSTPSLSDKDKKDLAWCLTNHVDYVAMSFVRSARDVRSLRSRMAETGHTIPIIAKIEKPEAVEDIDAILAEADGIMVARGDLGIEISTQRLPIVQKDLIYQANRLGKLVITATQMLESMIECPIPTRAESSDVANAIFDGTDAVMLSGETAYGKHPVEAVAEMTRIASEAERSRYLRPVPLDTEAQTFNAYARVIATTASHLAREAEAKAVLVFDQRLQEVLLLSKMRSKIPAVLVCHEESAQRQMCLYWGVLAVVTARSDDFQDLLERAGSECLRHGMVKDGDTVVVIYGRGEQGANTIKVHRI
jgi:pyruvate kinase